MIPISDDAADLTDCDTIASDHMRTGGENDGVQKTTDDPSPEKPGPAKYDHNLRHAQAALCSRCLECRQKSSRLFSSFSAIAVALASSVAALVYYSGNRTSGSVSFFGRLVAKVARARRAYYARLRKPIKVEVAGPERVVYRDGKEQVVVEKEVVRFIDRPFNSEVQRADFWR